MMWALLWRRYCAGALLSDVFQRRCSWKGAGEESDRWVLVPDICISLSYKSRPQPPTRTNTAPYIIRRRTRRVMSPRLSVVGDEIFPENMKPSLPNNETFTSEIILMRAIINVLRLRRWDCRTFYCLLLLYHSSLQIPTRFHDGTLQWQQGWLSCLSDTLLFVVPWYPIVILPYNTRPATCWSCGTVLCKLCQGRS